MSKAILSFIMLLGIITIYGQSQLENCYFAAWEDIPSNAPPGVYQEPVGNTWATSNEASMTVMTTASVKKTTDSYLGEYAALIQTVLIGTIHGSGTLFTGKFKLEGAPSEYCKFGIPFTDRPVYLQGFYKYYPVSRDSCRIASWLTKWNSTTHKRDTIAAASITRGESIALVNTYTEFDIIYNYYSGNSPDSITVIFASSADGANYNAAVGSKLYIDELLFGYYPLPVEKIKSKKDILVYPNPVSEYLIIESSIPANGFQLKIYNSDGSLIRTKKINNSLERVTISGFAVGLYFYVLNKSDGSTETGKFFKK
jgi:hypothetical protein